ncbi:hypothetical protein ABFV99_27035 [Cytobacillus horneckiae]|uniref:hypothetical protein n=1 Tax=Cytobacillus horneckiae TaxID=549687 RepID=UPI002DBDC96E|nr:hypothetical protein [Cytobacillus horneckiae]MEC1155456.1 hypothetical protein [Cytobacillus horneckiae]MED2940505.1 hypothetical protein [Cytobacillus horneckiae]
MAHCQDQKAGAAISIASNFIPGGGLASKAVKAAIKGTSKAYKAAKATKKATTKIKRSPSKKVSSKVNKKPKTVAAKPIRTAPKVQSKAKVKVAGTVKTKPKIKTYVAPKPNRGATVNRVAKNAVKTEKQVVSSDVKVAPKEASKEAPKGGNTQSTEEAESQFLMKLDLQNFAKNKETNGSEKNIYIPKDKNGKPVQLPKHLNGEIENGTVHKPDTDAPHTQIGARKGRKGVYRQTLEWGYNGKPVQRTDWTDHGRGDHVNPHSHPAKFKDGSWSFKGN